MDPDRLTVPCSLFPVTRATVFLNNRGGIPR